MSSAYLEKVAQFGPSRGLVGVLTVPAHPTPGAPAVIVLNSGILHRIGSNRLSVTAARELGAIGLTSLRFDLSGIGDSERRTDVPSLRESVDRDIADAMNFLASKHGAERFILMGVCSGAYDALHAALGDVRIVGVFMVDLPGPFQGRGHTLHHLKSRLFRVSSWRNPLDKVARYYRALRSSPSAPAERVEVFVDGARSTPSRDWMEQHLAVLLTRRVRLCFIFTAGFEWNYNHRSQFREAFPKAAGDSAVTYDFFSDADHSFSAFTERKRLVDYAARWIAAGWPPRDRMSA